ncbi:Cof-type HAD-IIB family hydrolase [Clostridium cellulovorans]|uniref:Cof-like hydrolase n=1 Tax=Clostridium cellulovorans (strain ATCC 35296 / DSM 3052 / OCM 3 / 743B) TaxID=573061 RepID=D9SRW2_CLOC7|nr:Cof-type HAD-IIB family hydrolase [Clostridium cellulovorans]ADL50479.1 Cof-like hydrolase [Clostridium cellulovorans 743B]
MAIKLVCIDMDGTLLSNHHEVHPKNLEAIKKATDLGVKIAIATGRIFASAKIYCELLGIKTPIISANGGYIRYGDTVMAEHNMGYENCKKIVEVLEKFKSVYYLYTADSMITNANIPETHPYRSMNDQLSDKDKLKFYHYDDISDAVENHGDKIIKCIVMEEDFEEIQKIRQDINKIQGLEVVSSYTNNIEMMAAGVTKGKGAEALAKYYGFSRDEVMCIGDSENDLSMVTYAGFGVAMGNGNEAVKKAAKYITDTNVEGGVGKAIEKFVIEPMIRK